MKQFLKEILFAFTLLALIGCSKDDAPIEEAPNNNYYTFGYTDECGNDSTGSFCVTKEDYNEAMANPYYITDTCFKVRIKDLNGNLEFFIFSFGLNSCN